MTLEEWQHVELKIRYTAGVASVRTALTTVSSRTYR